MRFMAIHFFTKAGEAGPMPTTEQMQTGVNFHEEQVKARVLLQAEGLHPSSKGARVRFSGRSGRSPTGRSPRRRSSSAGSGLLRPSRWRNAIEWVKRIPNLWPEDTEIEVRQVAEAEDVEAMTPELEAQIARLHGEAPLGRVTIP